MRRSLLLRHRPVRMKWTPPSYALLPTSPSTYPTSTSIPKFDAFSRDFSCNHRRQQDLQTDLPGSQSLIEHDFIVGAPTPEDAADPDPATASSDPISSLVLRPYQLACEDKCIEALKTYSRVGISSPTGSGKTAIFTSLIRRLAPISHSSLSPSESPSIANRVLILVGSIELAKQAAQSVAKSWPLLTVELEQGSKHIASGQADVTIATYQTLARASFRRLAKFSPDDYKAVIVDEAHHACAKSYRAILSHFDSRIDLPFDNTSFEEGLVVTTEVAPRDEGRDLLQGKEVESRPVEEVREAERDDEGRVCVPIIGFSATFGRADGASLGKVFETIAYHSSWLDMIRSKWLSELHFTTVRLDTLDLTGLASSKGDFATAALAEKVDTKEVRDFALQAWCEKAHSRKSTLVFAVNIKHIISLTEAFRERGIDARFIHEKTPPSLRASVLAGFRNQQFPVLVNCGILTEGADFPAIDCVLLARPTKSQNLFLQQIGRGLRLSPETGKTSCLIIDLIGRSASSLVCTPTLFGIDPELIVEGQSTHQLALQKKAYDSQLEESAALAASALAEEQGRQIARAAEEGDAILIYRDYQSVFDLVESTIDKPERLSLGSLGSLSWVGLGNSTYMIDLKGAGRLQISLLPESEPRKYEAKLYEVIHGAHCAPKPFGSHTSLPILIRTVEAAIQLLPQMSGIDLRRSAPWRKREASAAQKAFIIKKLVSLEDQLALEADRDWETTAERKSAVIEGIWVGKRWSEQVEVESLTKGQATDIIARLLNGGLGFYRREKKEFERRMKKLGRRAVK